MGYTTDFSGSFKLDKPLAPEHSAYLSKFAGTRRMKRNATEAETLTDPIRESAGLPIGLEGGFFVGGTGFAGQHNDKSVVDYNIPPAGQPGLWCQWVPSVDSSAIEWDGGEKFYDYVKWLKFLIVNFLKPWGYVLNGEVAWQGEESSDIGKIIVKDNVVTTSR